MAALFNEDDFNMQSGSGQVPLGLSNNIAGSGHLGPLACSAQPKRYDFHRRSLGAFRNKSNSFVQNFHRRKHGNDQNNAEQKAPPSLNLPDVDSLVPAGEHSGKGFQDTAYPVTGRGRP